MINKEEGMRGQTEETKEITLMIGGADMYIVQ